MPGPASSYTAFAFNVLVSKLHKASHLSLSKFSALPSSSDSDTVIDENEKYPMFVTWNIYDKRYHGYILRGCIGTFVPHLALEKELESYALKAALEDPRFDPISIDELPKLECGVTILSNFEKAKDALDWELGVHGIKITFNYSGRQLSATFLPDVAVEQGWTKEQTLTHLVRKAGANIKSMKTITELVQLVRYKGSKTSMTYEQYNEFMSSELPITA